MQPEPSPALALSIVPLDAPAIVGHRGFPTRALENTLASFDAALKAGARGIECDVWPTRDGHPVVFHDETLARLTGRQERISDLTLDSVRTIQLDRGTDARIPDLEDVLVLASERDAFALVELKGESKQLARAVVASVERTRTENRVAFLSFSLDLVREMQQREPAIPCAPVFEKAPNSLDASWRWVVVDAKGLTDGFVRTAARRGVKIACYGVDDGVMDEKLDTQSVGLRITDRTDLLVARRRT